MAQLTPIESRLMVSLELEVPKPSRIALSVRPNIFMTDNLTPKFLLLILKFLDLLRKVTQMFQGQIQKIDDRNLALKQDKNHKKVKIKEQSIVSLQI